MSVRLICGYQFRLVANLEAERDSRGNVVEFDPRGPGGASLSGAPFCRFVFPANLHQGGVYAVTVDDRPVYVGETNNLSRRFGQGEYGHIELPPPGSPQVTNRRVNHGILRALQRGLLAQVWFHESDARQEIEGTLISRLDLPWNRQAPQASRSRFRPLGAPQARAAWTAVLRAADAAKMAMYADRIAGERTFRELLAKNPDDGMVPLRRAEAYERLGLLPEAAADYALAEELLPFPKRKAEARAGLYRVSAVGPRKGHS